MKIQHYDSKKHIVDRENDVNVIKKLLCEATKSQVHIVFAKSGFGKTSFSSKLAQESALAGWDIIRVQTNPKNSSENASEGEYLDVIFDAMRKHFSAEEYTELHFDKYLSNGDNKLIQNLQLNEVIDAATSTDSIKKLPWKLLSPLAKRITNTGVFNPYAVIYDSSTNARSIKTEYIRFLLESTHILLIIENIQNIDNISHKYLLDWINDTKDMNHGFLLEYTISETHGINDVKSLQRSIVRTGVDVYESELEKLEVDFIAEVIETQIDNRPTDIHFTVRAQQHYNTYSDGNLWDLLDYARIYEDSPKEPESPEPTLLILQRLSDETKYIVSILMQHNGRIDQSHLHYIWLNYFSNRSESYLLNLYQELLQNHTIKICKNTNLVSISHASIIDVWQDNRKHFSVIDKEVYNRIAKFYNANYHEEIHVVDKHVAWQMLLQFYAIHQPEKIMDLLNDFKVNVMKNISREKAWKYLNTLITHTKDRIDKLIEVYFDILRICYSIFLYNEGYSCVEMMESKIDIRKNDLLLLHKLLYLSIIDRQQEAIILYKEVIGKTERYSKKWVNLKLIMLNCYIALSDEDSCWQIHKELKKMPGLKKIPEYAIFLRLTNIYMSPQKAVKNAKKSIKLFAAWGNQEQEGKSYITYSKLLSSIGKHKQAMKTIKQAEILLIQKNVGFACIYNNLAGYLLLSNEHGPEVWNYLDIAETYSVSTYDKLSTVLNKLAWCFENNIYLRLDLLENKALELIDIEPNQFIHCTTYYNLYVVMQAAKKEKKAKEYYEKAVALKEHCSFIKARIDGITWKERHLKPRIQTPYHICYLSFWVFDLQW